jgi:L-fuconolactonase
MIVDAHHHIWRYEPGSMAWLDKDMRAELAPLRRDFSAEELRGLLEANGIDGTVLVQADDTLADTRSMLEVAKHNDFVLGIVGWVPLEDTQATEAQLSVYAGEPKIRGFRHLRILVDPDPDWMIRPAILDSLRLVAERGYVYDYTNSTFHHLEHVCTLAEKIPSLKVIVNHLGKPAVQAGEWEPWAGLMARAAQFPNVYVKLSGLTNLATRPITNGTREQFQPYVDYLIDHFGPNRLIIASNWPPSVLATDYTTTWSDTKDLIAHLPATERAAILGENAMHVYGLSKV